MLTATDLFCGAGGSSLGAEMAGVQLVMAANHWAKAIETHQRNFPDAAHDHADISQVDPRRHPRTNLLIASPECVNHTNSKGVSRKKQTASLFEGPDPGAERSRATMWDVHRFVECHRYDAVVVENVVEARDWIYWPSWWRAWEDARYEARVLSVNSAHTGEVHQWRDRIYVVAVKRGLMAKVDLELRPPSWCASCERVVEGKQSWRNQRLVGRWKRQYDFRCPSCSGVVVPPAPPAEAIIDWSLPCPRIGDRSRPLADATRRRIAIGIDRYGSALVAGAGQTWERPGSGYARAWPLDQPAQAQTATAQHALAVPPFMVYGYDYRGGDERRVKPIDEPLGTVTAEGKHHALVVPFRANGHARPASVAPLSTIAAKGNHHGLLMAPQSDGKAKPTSRPSPAQVTAAAPLLLTYTRTGRAQPVTDPASTVTTRDRHALVHPAIEVDDCGFRMLQPHESGRAMAFPDTYIVEGTKQERQKLYGNAVTPPVMRLLAERIVAALEAS